MSVTVQLTNNQVNQITTDVQDRPVRLTAEQINNLANKLHAKIPDLPFIPTGKEKAILRKLVKKVDLFLWETLPDEIYELIHDAHDGLENTEVAELTTSLTELANKNINIPYLPETVEHAIFGFLIGLILEGLKRNINL